MNTPYRTRQPITTSNIEAFMASLPPKARTARVNGRLVKSEALIESMSDAMRIFGEGMTRADLRRAGFTDRQIDACAEQANHRAVAKASGSH